MWSALSSKVHLKSWILICQWEKPRRNKYLWITELSTTEHSVTHPTVTHKQQESLYRMAVTWVWRSMWDWSRHTGDPLKQQETRALWFGDLYSHLICLFWLLVCWSSLQFPTKVVGYLTRRHTVLLLLLFFNCIRRICQGKVPVGLHRLKFSPMMVEEIGQTRS